MNTEYLNMLEKFRGTKILVLGDFILDVYLKGSSTRLSPEAPVPVVDVQERVSVTGGAANTAVNLKMLGADVTFLSVLGKDEEGYKAIELLKGAGVDTYKIIHDEERTTIVKTRVMAGNHILTRYDWGTETLIGSDAEQVLISYLYDQYPMHDAIVISDYHKGVVTQRILEALIDLQHKHDKFVAVDSKRLGFFKDLKPSLAKPNYDEVVKLLNLSSNGANRIEQIQACGEALYQCTGAAITAVTMDQDGTVVFKDDQYVHMATAPHIAVPNVVGAGDTFISAFTLAVVAGADIPSAAHIACTACGITVGKEGTASCSLEELTACFTVQEKQVRSLEQLARVCDLYHSQGKRIVFTNGCFDILHSGHVSYLNRAKQLGDVLIVGVNTDDSIRRIKGKKRPINPLADRAQVLSGLSSIDHIMAFGDVTDDTPVPLIKVVKPHIFVKGGDYTREQLPEAETVEAVGGEIIFLSLVPDHSTTRIVQQIYKTSTLAVA